MNNALYFNPYSGVSGDMFVASLIDLGADFEFIKDTVKSVLPEVYINHRKVYKNGFIGSKFEVLTSEDGIHVEDAFCDIHRDYLDIVDMLNKGLKDEEILLDCNNIFKMLACSESKVHGIDFSAVHFHEVGAVDSIVDIVAGVAAMKSLNCTRVISSPLNIGGGVVNTSHGALPVPAPATAELLKDLYSYSSGTYGELVTPTGAALMAYYCKEFTDFPLGRILRVGYGAGSRDLPFPNLLRVILYNLKY